MAISGGDGSIILTTKVDETGLKKGLGSMKKFGATAGKAFLAIGAAAGAATVAITKMAVSAYADYEQLVGGVETLFKGSAQKVIDYANDAFYTAGVSANEYMQQVTSFSASLIRSTAGDTDKAADIANMALIDISDNVNKMGSSMESVTLAYQGFAKQQYMLLDNLKLGYGGTKTEMQRLLKDAEALTGVKYNIENLADVYSAIHAIQEELGITGTTAKEAEKTITGSANMMKAAWQNVLAAISGGGDLDRAINNLVYSVTKYMENIVPVVQRSLIGIGRLIEQVAPLLVQNVASALIQSIPSLINAIYQMIIGLAKGIWQGIKALFTGGSGSVTADIKTSVGGIASSVGDATTGMEELGDATEKAGKKAQKSLAGFDKINKLSENASSGAGAGGTSGISAGGGGGLNVNTSALGEVEGFTSVIQEQFAKIAEMATQIWNSEPIQVFVETSKTILGTLWSFITTLWQDVQTNASTTWGNIQGNVSTIISNLMQLWTQFWTDMNVAIQTWGQPIIESISGLFNSIWSTAIDPAVQFIIEMWAGFTETLADLWDEHGQPLVDNIGEFIDTTIGLFQSLYDNILAPIITPIFEAVSELWEEHVQPLVKKIGDFILTLTNGALEIYNKFIAPITQWLVETFSPIWESTIGSIIEWFSDWFGNIVDIVSGIITTLRGVIDFIVGIFTGDWKKAWEGLKTVLKGVLDTIVSIFKTAWSSIKGVWNATVGFFKGVWTSIKNVFSPVASWFKSTFSKAWTAVKNVFSGWSSFFDGLWTKIKNKFSGLGTSIANAIGGSVKKGMNGVITIIENTINKAIGLINGAINLVNKIPGVSVNKVSNIKLPRLAQGAVIPPNREFLAVLGDQKQGTNIETPLKTMIEAFNIALNQRGDVGGDNQPIVILLDGEVVYQTVVKKNKKYTMATGVNPLGV